MIPPVSAAMRILLWDWDFPRSTPIALKTNFAKWEFSSTSLARKRRRPSRLSKYFGAAEPGNALHWMQARRHCPPQLDCQSNHGTAFGHHTIPFSPYSKDPRVGSELSVIN